jgi:hypothetical protein
LTLAPNLRSLLPFSRSAAFKTGAAFGLASRSIFRVFGSSIGFRHINWRSYGRTVLVLELELEVASWQLELGGKAAGLADRRLSSS